jgi:hypothetical protein
MARLGSQIKQAKSHKKDMRQLKGGWVLTGGRIRDGIAERGEKPSANRSNLKRAPQSTYQPISVTLKQVGVRFRLSPRRNADDTPSSASETSISSSHSQKPRHTPPPRLSNASTQLRIQIGALLTVLSECLRALEVPERRVGGWVVRG